MDVAELQAKATIAAALIISHAVEIPNIPRIPKNPDGALDSATVRLGDLTDYVYRAITRVRV
jgi:hypothetical protein